MQRFIFGGDVAPSDRTYIIKERETAGLSREHLTAYEEITLGLEMVEGRAVLPMTKTVAMLIGISDYKASNLLRSNTPIRKRAKKEPKSTTDADKDKPLIVEEVHEEGGSAIAPDPTQEAVAVPL